ncbi:type II toxin-antitoxin system RelE family toxin [Streptomyces daliensis]|uniref:Type II toxin-antitoxin system RelE/ParE family toxin n=1 Tax=Streptomyces daliensis TaxID=299421 RepID=A0A8T4IQB6_9ACTN|nr:type II toxin-antitoxin system RelE/ParE family toxin [Streptomyces daliensis]
MGNQVQWETSARSSFARFRAQGPEGTTALFGVISDLPNNPRPRGAQPYGPDRMRIHVAQYRVIYRINDGPPVIISVEHIGRSR